VQHETRLRGFVDGGVELAEIGERISADLPAGNYVFEARACTGDGRWSHPATFAFTRPRRPRGRPAGPAAPTGLLLLAGVYGDRPPPHPFAGT